MKHWILIAAILLASCSNPVLEPKGQATSIARPQSSAASSAREQNAACRASDRTRQLALIWANPLGTDLTTYLWDVTSVAHPVSVCGLVVPDQGPIRFVTATKVSVSAHNALYELDIKTGVAQVLARWRDPQVIAAYDTTAGGATAAYAIFDGKDTVAFHLIHKGADSLITTFPELGFGGSTRVEFSPSGKYFALGATGASANSKTAPVEVRTLDGRLKFTSRGTAWFTWAGSGDQLYFENGTSIVRWDGGPAVTQVIDGSWSRPNASPDRRHVAYEIWIPSEYAPQPREARTRVLDVATGTWIELPGKGAAPVFLTDTVIHHQRWRDCAGVCDPEYLDYDLAAGSDTNSSVYYVFSTWPRGTPSR